MGRIAIYLLIGIIIEAITFNFGMFRHVESFFFVWGVLYLGILLFTVFKVDTSTYTMRFSKTGVKFRNSEDIIAERKMLEPKKSLPSTLIFLAIMFIGNTLLFIVLMP
ncbi:hypothetical protein [Fusibacter sp. JL216-2]|uniref:hypothetical protein n=1 Tax=Fusibacter sp. JL216-2 TaxID=3071453 RepID=UPI003D34DBE2